MERLPDDAHAAAHTDPPAELVAALALGLAASWRDRREQLAELRATTDVAHAVAARAVLTGLQAPDPQATTRAIDLLDAAFPPATGRATITRPPVGGAATRHPAVSA